MITLHNTLIEIQNAVFTYRKNIFNKKRIRYVIPFNAFDYNHDIRILDLYKIKLENFYKKYKINVFINLDYEIKKFVIYEVLIMKTEFTINIPYDSRSNYYKAIYEINNLVDKDGCVIMAVDNNCYDQKSVLYIETNINVDKINDVISKYKLRKDNSIGINEILTDIGNRKYNIQSLSPYMPFELLSRSISVLFFFPEKKFLEDLGYGFNRTEKKKVFISYTHKDKDIVHDISNHLEDSGLNIWIDKKKLDVGDHIIETIGTGIKECDLHIIFISNNTKEAAFAKHEITTIFSQVIYNDCKWFIVRLDKVDPNDLYLGLGNYLYYDYDYNENGIEKLIEKIKIKLEKL